MGFAVQGVRHRTGRIARFVAQTGNAAQPLNGRFWWLADSLFQDGQQNIVDVPSWRGRAEAHTGYHSLARCNSMRYKMRMGIVSASIQCSRVFSVGRNELAKLFQMASVIETPVEMTVYTRNRRTYSLSHFEDLTSLSNGRGKRIFSIEFRAARGEQLFFVDISRSTGISARVRGDLAFVESQTVFLEEVAESCKPWYSFFYGISYFWLMLISIFLTTIYLSTGPFGDGLLSVIGKPLLGMFGPNLPIILLYANWFLGFFIIARDVLFPKTAFFLGDEIGKMRLIVSARSVVLGTIVLGVIINLISSSL